MDNTDSLIWCSPTRSNAEAAIRALHQSGVDITTLSLLGKGYHTEEQPLGFYNVGAKMRAWGGLGAFWGGFWGLLMAPAVFVLPGIGVVAMAGPLVAALFGALEGAVTVGSAAALAAALSTIGVPSDQVITYSSALKADGYALLMHGDAGQIAKARQALELSLVAHGSSERVVHLPRASSGNPITAAL